jgi:hypothetical protein
MAGTRIFGGKEAGGRLRQVDDEEYFLGNRRWRKIGKNRLIDIFLLTRVGF